MISVIIPTYRNPAYLDLCLKSATENSVADGTEIIVIIDGFVDESMSIVEKYPGVNVLPLADNRGMQYALNIGVMQATNEWIFVINDDNVFGVAWDSQLENLLTKEYTANVSNTVFTINQVEPSPSMFNFVTRDFGRTAETFRYDEWLVAEAELINESYFSSAGRIFPFLMTKKWYMAVGGFDTIYDSPFWCDCDFFLKLEITNQLQFLRYSGIHLYHFGGTATKTRKDADALMFQQSESPAAQMFGYKWGFIPNLAEAVQRDNSKLPLDNSVKGVIFR